MYIYRFIHKETKAVGFSLADDVRDAEKAIRELLYHRPKTTADEVTRAHYERLEAINLLASPKKPYIRKHWHIDQYEGEMTRYAFNAFLFHLDRSSGKVINLPARREPPKRRIS